MSVGPGDDVRVLRTRLQIMTVVVSIVFATLVARLFQLQILEGEHYARRAEANFTETVDVEAPRGRIFDTHGNALAINRPAYTLYVTARPRLRVPSDEPGREHTRKRVPVRDDAIDALVEVVDFADARDRDKLVARIRELRDDPHSGRYAVAVRSNLSWEENARIQTRAEFSSWVEIRESARRFYPAGELVAFVTGYMREINPERLEASPRAQYKPGDRVGQTGLERQWENYLRGRSGSRSRLVDSMGRVVALPDDDDLENRRAPRFALEALPRDRDSIPGQDIHLSLDLDLQRVAEQAFEGKHSGGVVAMEVHTGRVLTMVSVPGIDPNAWEQPISRAQYQGWLESPFKPFVDKTVQENYFPGSTYKVVSALAMLEDPSFDPNAEIECNGFIDYGNRRFTDTHRHGVVDLHQAIVQSCNVYFWHLAIDEGLTLARMEAAARKLGLGERTGLGINAEVRGVVPTEASESRQGRFERGVQLNSAIGQGNVKATVLQLGVLYAALANGGYVVFPTLVDEVRTFDGRVVLKTRPQRKNREPALAAFDRERIHRGLVGVVHDDKGTAFSEQIAGVNVAGKTGTAEVGIERVPEGVPGIEGWDITKDHAWFAAYAPAEDPEITVVALVAHGGAGADAAAPIVMRVVEHYLGDRAGGGVAPRAPGVPPPLPGGSEEGQR
jgi:penicillin-binding protein 2